MIFDKLKKIKYKIVWIVLITSTIVVAIGQVIGFYYNIIESKKQLANRAEVYAQLIGEYCIAPLAFNDVTGVDEVLIKLNSLPEVKRVYVFNDQGSFVTYYKDDNKDEVDIRNIQKEKELKGFLNNEYYLSLPIMYDDVFYGTIYLISSTDLLDKKIKSSIFMMIALFLVLVFLTYFLAGQFQKVITSPITKLINTVTSITKEGDYNVRVKTHTQDEIGRLYDGFNNMLEQIQKRQRAQELAEEVLLVEHDKAKNYLDVASVIIMALDVNANILQVNKMGCELLEIDDEDDVIGKNWYDLFVPVESQQQGKEAYNKQIFSGVVTNDISEEAIVTAKGNSRLIAWRDTILKDNEGKIIGLLGSAEDITEKRAKDKIIQASQDKLNSVIDNSPVGIFHFDFDSIITMCNKAICNLYDVKTDQLIGSNLLNISNEIAFKESIEVAIGGYQGLFEGDHTTSFNDKKLQIRAIFTPLFDNEGLITGGMGMVEDISERLRHDKMKQDWHTAEASNKAKSEFLARMSHEIRTPMNAILGLSHLALKTQLNTQQHDYIDKIESSGKHLLGIINDILDYSKIEAGKLNIEKVSFSFEKILRDLSNLITFKANEKGLEFIFVIDKDVPYFVIGDSLRLSQVLTNLANNAVKFTDSGEVILRVSVVNREKKNVEIKFIVEDTGIGMSEDQMTGLFQSFSQADISTSRKYGGTGLGLAISKRLVNLMGGDIWVESEVGEGSKFIFTTIFGTEPASYEIPEVIVTGIKVLVCDDNQKNLEFICQTAELFQFDVTGVGSGFEAIKVLEASEGDPFNLVIMDWMMPEMDGLETIRRIKSNNKIQSKPGFIVLTTYRKDDNIHRQFKYMNLDVFIEKPLTRSSLFDAMMTALGKEKIFGSKSIKEEIIPENLDKLIGSKILYAEDNLINQQVVKELLESEGFEIDIANNGEEAVKMISNSGIPSKYDIVLMDIQMPIMDGYTATIQIRNMNQYDKLPILAISADAMSGVADKCLKIGMQDFISKPISPEKVYAALVKWISPRNLTVDEIESKKEKLTAKKGNVEEVDVPQLNFIFTTEGIRRMGGNKQAYLEMLHKFYINNKDFIPKVGRLHAQNNHEELHRAIHTLKGVSGNIGAKNLHNEAVFCEQEMKKKTEYDFDAVFGKIEKQLDFVLVELKESIIDKLDEEDQVSSGPVDSIKMLNLLTKLEVLLKESDAEAVDVVNELAKIGRQVEYFDEIKNSLSTYNFEDAIVATIKMKNNRNYLAALKLPKKVYVSQKT